MIEQFCHSHNPDLWRGETAVEVKTLVRKDFPLHYFGAHRPFLKPKLKTGTHPIWTDGSGRAVPHRFLAAAHPRRIRRFPAKGARHYALRSLDSYLVKMDRGDVNRENRNFDDTYWRERNDPAWEDRSIQRHLPRLRARMNDLRLDENIGELHDACVKAHIARRDALLETKAYRTLRDQLLNAPTIPPRKRPCCVIWA